MPTSTTTVGAVTSTGLTGLTAGTGYQVRVRARDAAGNWSGWSTAVSFTTDDAPDDTLAVTLDEVKRHGNITGTAADDELPIFIETAQQMVANLVGAIVPATVVAEHHTISARSLRIWLRQSPVLQVTGVQELNATNALGTLTDSDWYLDPQSGALMRLSAGAYTFWTGSDVLVTYRAGRDPVPAAIRWAIMEQAIHLWRSTQAQRGGRARGDISDAAVAAGFGMPNRVRDALAPFTKAPVIA